MFSAVRLWYVCGFLAASQALQTFDTWSHGRVQLGDVSIHFRYSESGKPPLMLVHGSPQHSRTWTHIGPILAEHYTVIAADNRGMGDSTIPLNEDYTAFTAGDDLRAILDFLRINKTFVFSHDKGVGLATSLALENPGLVERLIMAEYPLPGFGYDEVVTSPDLYRNWQLAFFAVPDAAAFFVQGREREMLEWYFFHGSYSGPDSIPNDLFEVYVRSLSKPGFMRAMMGYFAAAFADETYFTDKFKSVGKLQMPILGMGGEASFAPAGKIRQCYDPIVADLETVIVPRAGHWLGDENPVYAANKAIEFFGNGSSIPALDISWLEDTYTMFGDFGNPNVTPGTNDTTT